MKAFVTGGSGFVGRSLIAALVARGDTVAALARSDSARRTVQALGAEAIRGDLDDVVAIGKGMQGAGVAYHSAAVVGDWGDPADFERINVIGTKNVIAAARAAHVQRLVHVSTEAVLANGVPIRNADEDRPRASRPIGLYPATKARAEVAALAANGDGLEVVVVRPRFIWGKGDTTLLPQIVGVVDQGKWAWINGGRYLSSTCHVRNVVEGTLLAAERGRPGSIYFLTDGPPVEFRSFISAMVQTQGKDPGRRSIPYWLAYAIAAVSEVAWRRLPLKGRPPVTRMAVLLVGEEVTVDDSKARRELGYRSLVSREAGLAELVPG